MATHASVGQSMKFNSTRAGREAAQKALDGFKGDRADIALVFGTAGYDQRAMLAGLRETLGPDVRVVGCSGEGVITQSGSDECDCTVAVMLIASDTVQYDPFMLGGYGEDSKACATVLADRLEAEGTDDLMGVILLPDGLSGNCTDLLETLDARLPEKAMMVGGASADAMQMAQTFQYLDGDVMSEGLAGVVMRGKGRLDIAVSHGCTPVGLEHTITGYEDGWIHEIDGQPAWDIFKQYLDNDAKDLNAEGIVHLCIGKMLDEDLSEGYSPYVIRTPLGLENGSLFFPGGGIEEGEAIMLARRDPDYIKKSAKACAEQLMERGKGQRPSLLLQFDCAGRGRILFGNEASKAIVTPMQEVLGRQTPWLGLHTLGEIAPISGTPFYHNYTVVLCAIYDDCEAATTQLA